MKQDGRERGEAWLLFISKLDLAPILREELDHLFARTYVAWTDVTNTKRCPVKRGLHLQIKRLAKEWVSRGYEADATLHGDFVQRDGTHSDTYTVTGGSQHTVEKSVSPPLYRYGDPPS